ncbi:MAG: VOC family protein [Xanthomonadaceae bacterium]|jgi:catechol 2,3-dioxygenase-like lactoylglutathione lyase family enzyme|nr:VOC family protein [Xanthomonadaceae bacterium]
MIGYVTLGTNDLPRAAAWYDTLLADLGAKRIMQDDRYVAWGNARDRPALALFIPFDQQPATAGNGTMVALAVREPRQVDALHAHALRLGAKDEGRPGPRPNGFYAGYFRDLDGNKLNVFCIP